MMATTAGGGGDEAGSGVREYVEGMYIADDEYVTRGGEATDDVMTLPTPLWGADPPNHRCGYVQPCRVC